VPATGCDGDVMLTSITEQNPTTNENWTRDALLTSDLESGVSSTADESTDDTWSTNESEGKCLIKELELHEFASVTSLKNRKPVGEQQAKPVVDLQASNPRFSEL
jgi:hypothetical protein